MGGEEAYMENLLLDMLDLKEHLLLPQRLGSTGSCAWDLAHQQAPTSLRACPTVLSCQLASSWSSSRREL